MSSVLLAAPHHGLAEGIRLLLATEFDTIVMVADETSLRETAQCLVPDFVVVDVALARGNVPRLVRQLHDCCPELKVILLSGGDVSDLLQAATDARADGLVAKGRIATDLLPAIERALRQVPRSDVESRAKESEPS